MALGAADQHGRPCGQDQAKCLPQAPGPRAGVLLAGQGLAGRAHRVDVVALRAPGTLEPADLHDLFSRPGKERGKPRREAAHALQRPDPLGRCVAINPRQHPGVTRCVGAISKVGTGPTGRGVHHDQIDGVSVGVAPDDVIVLFCQHDHAVVLSSKGRTQSAPAWEQVTRRGSTVKGHARKRTSS